MRLQSVSSIDGAALLYAKIGVEGILRFVMAGAAAEIAGKIERDGFQVRADKFYHVEIHFEEAASSAQREESR